MKNFKNNFICFLASVFFSFTISGQTISINAVGGAGLKIVSFHHINYDEKIKSDVDVKTSRVVIE